MAKIALKMFAKTGLYWNFTLSVNDNRFKQYTQISISWFDGSLPAAQN